MNRFDQAAKAGRRPRAGARRGGANNYDPVGIALEEDLGAGDVTSRYFVRSGSGRARIFSREKAVVAGVDTAAEVFKRVNRRLAVTICRAPGSMVAPDETVLEVRGPIRSILTGERVALNFLQHLSGIATLTRRFVDALGSSSARILDTRKTTPGLRALEKAAVRAGGGKNHRFRLDEMVLVKDNHLLAGGGIEVMRKTLQRLRAEHPRMKIELEADTVEQVREFLALTGVDVILLDNMTLAQMRRAVKLGRGRVQFEASGGVTIERVKAIAQTGVDFISVGALTHSARAIDYSLELAR